MYSPKRLVFQTSWRDDYPSLNFKKRVALQERLQPEHARTISVSLFLFGFWPTTWSPYYGRSVQPHPCCFKYRVTGTVWLLNRIQASNFVWFRAFVEFRRVSIYPLWLHHQQSYSPRPFTFVYRAWLVFYLWTRPICVPDVVNDCLELPQITGSRSWLHFRLFITYGTHDRCQNVILFYTHGGTHSFLDKPYCRNHRLILTI